MARLRANETEGETCGQGDGQGPCEPKPAVPRHRAGTGNAGPTRLLPWTRVWGREAGGQPVVACALGKCCCSLVVQTTMYPGHPIAIFSASYSLLLAIFRGSVCFVETPDIQGRMPPQPLSSRYVNVWRAMLHAGGWCHSQLPMPTGSRSDTARVSGSTLCISPLPRQLKPARSI